MTYLQQLVEAQPLHERYPPHALACDKIPWSGDAAKVGRFVAAARETAGMLREWRAVDPQHPDAQRCGVMLVHFDLRVKTLLSSWNPQGLAN